MLEIGHLCGSVAHGLGIFMAALVLHELGHAGAAELLGLSIKRIRIGWVGIGLERAAGCPVANLLVSSAGPLMNAMVLIAAWPSLKLFALANFSLCVVNLLPVRGSDGDRILDCMEALGWLRPADGSRVGLARTHAWLCQRGFSDWDLEQMELADEWPAGRPPATLQKTESQIYLSRPVTRNSCSP